MICPLLVSLPRLTWTMCNMRTTHSFALLSRTPTPRSVCFVAVENCWMVCRWTPTHRMHTSSEPVRDITRKVQSILGTDSITVTKSVQSLGVTIDGTLSFNTDASHVCKAVRHQLTRRERCVMFTVASQKVTPFKFQCWWRRQDSNSATRFCIRYRSPIYRNLNEHKTVSWPIYTGCQLLLESVTESQYWHSHHWSLGNQATCVNYSTCISLPGR